jgi:hypothetical protein
MEIGCAGIDPAADDIRENRMNSVTGEHSPGASVNKQ